jgi:hypothetical protein
MRARPNTAAELRHAEGKLLAWDPQPTRRACALQPRDTALLAALGRYRFLTTVQIADLWWPGCALQVVRRRLTRLFEAGYVERFRPLTIRGSYQWIYCLARDGHRAAQQSGELPEEARFTPRREQIFDYRYVVHDLRLNDWVIAYRRLAGERVTDWHGPDESRLEAPEVDPRDPHGGSPRGSFAGLALKRPRQIVPDGALELVGQGGAVYLLLEYDRTRRVDKNYDKFRRYDHFLTAWSHQTEHADRGDAHVLFLCEDQVHLERFLAAADHELTGHRYFWRDGVGQEHFASRQRVLFGLATDVYAGELSIYRVPELPPGHPDRAEESAPVRRYLPHSTAK